MLAWPRKKPKGPYAATIAPPGRTLPVRPDETLLQAALAAGIPFPHNCRVGSCTTCKCRLVSGRIEALTDTSYVLSAEDLHAGYILACQSLLKSDVEIALDRLDAPCKNVAGVICAVKPLTHDILEVRIALDQAVSYTAGQYAELSVPAVAEPRNYSFAQAPAGPEQAEICFHIRHVPGGELTDWLHQADRTGTRVGISAPHGSFWLRPGAAPILCIAGGSGMAPIKAILEQAQRDGCTREVLYLFGARAQRDLYCVSEMERLGENWNGRFRFTPVLSREPADSGWAGARGLVADFIAAHGLDPARCDAYLCGPPPMVDAAIARLTAAGLAAPRIHFDKFLDRSHAARAVNVANA